MSATEGPFKISER